MLSSKINDMTLLVFCSALILILFMWWVGSGAIRQDNSALQSIVKAATYKDADNSARAAYGSYYLDTSLFEKDVSSQITTRYGSKASAPKYIYYGWATVNGKATATKVSDGQTVPDPFNVAIVRVDTTVGSGQYTTRYAVNKSSDVNNSDITYVQQKGSN